MFQLQLIKGTPESTSVAQGVKQQMKSYERICKKKDNYAGDFFKNEACVSRAVVHLVKPTFGLVTFVSAKTFVTQLAECVSLLLPTGFLSNVQVFR